MWASFELDVVPGEWSPRQMARVRTIRKRHATGDTSQGEREGVALLSRNPAVPHGLRSSPGQPDSGDTGHRGAVVLALFGATWIGGITAWLSSIPVFSPRRRRGVAAFTDQSSTRRQRCSRSERLGAIGRRDIEPPPGAPGDLLPGEACRRRSPTRTPPSDHPE